MELSPQDQALLSECQEILELNDSRPWQLFRARIEKAIAAINETLLTQKLREWSQYERLWNRRAALKSILTELDESVPRDIAELQRKADTEPDNQADTGAL